MIQQQYFKFENESMSSKVHCMHLDNNNNACLFQCAMRIFLGRLRLYKECSAFVEYKDFGLPAVDSMLQVFLKEREMDSQQGL
jgi:hypothetical protein